MKIYTKEDTVQREPDHTEDNVLTHTWTCRRTSDDDNTYMFRTPFDFSRCTPSDLRTLAVAYIVIRGRRREFRKLFVQKLENGNKRKLEVDEKKAAARFEQQFDVKAWLDAEFDAELVQDLYGRYDYMEAYRRHTDLRVEQDPRTAGGGGGAARRASGRGVDWAKGGKHQLDFLVAKGLAPHHRLLDLGCNTLKGGRHFIRYLESENYTGFDISPKALEYGQELVEREGLLEKQPRLVLNGSMSLKFDELEDERFEYIFARSVFTHLPAEHIEECFENLHKLMKKDTLFFFTYRQSDTFRRSGEKGYRYPFSFFENLAQRYDFLVADCSQDYPHRLQKVVELRAA